MDIDLPAILFWAVLACAVIWLIDVIFLKQKRLAADPEALDPPPVEYAKSFFPVLLLVLVLAAPTLPFSLPPPLMKLGSQLQIVLIAFSN